MLFEYQPKPNGIVVLVVKQLYRILNELKVENHPDKTYLGKSVNGFDFLGYLVNGSQLTVAKRQSSSPFYIGIRFMSSRKKRPLPKKWPLIWIAM
jgi:hypothetical protein